MKDSWIEPKLIDLGNNETKKEEDLIDCNDKTHKKVKRGLRTDATDRYKGNRN